MTPAPIIINEQQLHIVRALPALQVKRGDCTAPDDQQVRHEIGEHVVQALRVLFWKCSRAASQPAVIVADLSNLFAISGHAMLSNLLSVTNR